MLYTNKDLINVLPLNVKKIKECGVNTSSIIQVFANNLTHTFFNLSDVNLFNSLKLCEVEELTEEQTNIKIEELRAIEKQEQEKAYRQTDAYKISILETVNNTQEETIATISYELMMMQTASTTVELKVGEHSPKFNMIRIWYNKGFWTADMVRDAVEHKWLTQEEANEILGA